MAWNESGNGKNPWDRGGGDGPPDLDRIVRDWQRRLGALLGGGGRGGGPRRGGSGGPAMAGLVGLLLLGWVATGFYRVNDAERGVVLRFGAYTETTQPGLRWHIPWPVESVEKVNVAQVTPFSQKTRMLTADENIVVVDMVVQFQRANPVDYLFNVRDPDGTLRDVSESAIREVVGKSKVDFVLREGRAEIALNTQKVIQEALDEYRTGIIVTKVNLVDANFPEQVEAAVQDAVKAREDKERLGFEAQSYANDILPKARGEAVRRLQDAEAYKARVIANAEGEAARFEQLLAEYRQAPEVTRERLYLETAEQVFANSAKVVIDTESSGNLLYLPIDQLLRRQQGSAPPPLGRAPGTGSASGSSGGGASGSATRSQREALRLRGTR
ncbi:MAG: FtsH protease activity modulator HflK [Gammaproteobacteria bacterium]|nr:MAG: FtsH protease activity modulator HflK [Gammaproteobacteria bacterium]